MPYAPLADSVGTNLKRTGVYATLNNRINKRHETRFLKADGGFTAETRLRITKSTGGLTERTIFILFKLKLFSTKHLCLAQFPQGGVLFETRIPSSVKQFCSVEICRLHCSGVCLRCENCPMDSFCLISQAHTFRLKRFLDFWLKRENFQWKVFV